MAEKRGRPRNPGKIRIPNNWVPRKDQMPLWCYLEGGGKRAIEIAHRRWGKDDVALHFTATQVVQRVGNYWHMLPMYAQCRKSVWDAVNPRTGKRRIDEAFPIEIREKTRENDMFIQFKSGSSWQLVGSDNFNALVGSPPVGVIASEWALADPLCWPYIMPILEENNGYALFITTSRGNNHAKAMLDYALTDDAWFGEVTPADRTPVFTDKQLANIRKELVAIWGDDLGEALYQQEYHCSFEGAIMGAYFGKQIREARSTGRICNVPHQTGQEVFTFWDLGVDDSTTIWFMQENGQGFSFIDYYENTGMGMEHYAKVLKEKPYIYGEHIMPHDAEQRMMSNSEIAMSKKNIAEQLGIRPVRVVTRMRNMDVFMQVHVPAVRNVLSRCWFDKDKCARGINALEYFQAEFDEDKKVLKQRYLHNWCSHGSTAFITFAVGYMPMREVKPYDPQLMSGNSWMAA